MNNNIIFVVGRNGKETIGKLAEALGATVFAKWFLRIGQRWSINGERQKRDYMPSVDGKVVVRWASAAAVSGTPIKEFQPAKAILLASDKPRARLTLQEKGIPVPRTTTDYNQAVAWLECGMPIVHRPLHHHGGVGFVLAHTKEELPLEEGYYSEFYEKCKEFRVHVAHGGVLVCQEKVPREGINPVAGVPWNHATGDFVFSTIRRSQYRMDVILTAIDAVAALGLDYGAVDILADSPGLAPVVTEVNTSPGIGDYVLSKYLQYFEKILDLPRIDRASITSWKDVVVV